MERLSPSQRETLEQLQSILGHQNYNADVLVNVLESLDWNIQRATDILVSEHDEAPRDSSERRAAPVENPGIGGGHEPTSLVRMLFSLLYLPINIVSGILRFVSGVLRIPLWTLPFNSGAYRTLRPTYPDSRSATRRWITSLEEETGAVNLKSTALSATGLDSQQSISRRHTYPPTADDSKILPDFFDGSYEEVLDMCQKEGRIACAILVSAEHDDVPEFKRTTLTDPGFVRMLTENNFIVWGGDIRDQDSWDAAQKLQATTYPFVAFIALQPRRNHTSNPSSSSVPAPVLTILSRHHGPSVPESGPTSAQTLMHHLEHQLLPRVTPFLTRFRAQVQERERDRMIREQQDRAFQESADRDRERIQARIRAEQEEAERVRLEHQVHLQEEQKMRLERERQENFRALRLRYRRWMRRCIVPTEHRGADGIRLAVKLSGNTRVVRTFSATSTLTELYAFVDTQSLPLTLQPETDPVQVSEGPGSDLQKLEDHVQSRGSDAEAWWGFKLVLPYPRREIKWTIGMSLVGAGLKTGEQIVVEPTETASPEHHSDDDYESE